VGRAQAVSARVATAQDDYALAFGGDVLFRVDILAGQELVLLGEIIHGQVNSLQFAPGNGQVAGLGGTAGQADGVVFFQQVPGGVVDANVYAGAELHPLVGH